MLIQLLWEWPGYNISLGFNLCYSNVTYSNLGIGTKGGGGSLSWVERDGEAGIRTSVARDLGLGGSRCEREQRRGSNNLVEHLGEEEAVRVVDCSILGAPPETIYKPLSA